MKNNRIHWIDFAKGIAILLVVLGHVSFMPEPILASFYTFHIPLFFFLSGLFLFNKKEAFGPFFLKKSRTLIGPYYKFLAAQFIVFYGAYKLGFNHAGKYIPGWSSLMGLSELWFLFVLFFIHLFLFPFYRSNASPKKAVGGGILLILVVCLLKADCCSMNVPYEQFKGSTLPFGGDLLLFGGSFVVLGMAARGYLLEKKIPLWLAGVSMVVAIVCGVLNYRISGNHHAGFFEQFLGNPAFFYLSAISSIVVIIAMCQWLAEQGRDGDAVPGSSSGSGSGVCSGVGPSSVPGAEAASDFSTPSGRHGAIADFFRNHSLRRWLEWCGGSSLAIYAIHWMFVPFVCSPIFNYLVPLHPSILFKTACGLLAFLGILALTLPAAWFVENKMRWMVGRVAAK